MTETPLVFMNGKKQGILTVNCSVDNPSNHGEGLTGGFVTYDVITIILYQECTADKCVNEQKFIQKRRFRHFEWLQRRLMHDHPTCIIPPLPEKAFFSSKNSSPMVHFDNICKFGESFIQKRMATLKRFLKLICKNERLMNSEVFLMFCQNNVLPEDLDISEGNFVACITTSITNKFSTQCQISEENFLANYNKLIAIEANLKDISVKMNNQQKYLSRYSKKLFDTSLSLNEYSASLKEICQNKEIGESIELFGKCLKESSDEHFTISNVIESGPALYAMDYYNYSLNAKRALQIRESFKENIVHLQRQLKEITMEKEKIAQNSSYGTSNSLFGIYHKAIDSIKRISPDSTKQYRLAKLEYKLTEIQARISEEEEHLRQQNEDLLRDLDQFFINNQNELREIMLSYASKQLICIEKEKKRWESLLFKLSMEEKPENKTE